MIITFHACGMDFEAEVDYVPGYAAVMTMTNGDPGWPSEDPMIEINWLTAIVSRKGQIERWPAGFMLESDELFPQIEDAALATCQTRIERLDGWREETCDEHF
ncbi:MAG: hypothetical protein JO253_03280 [Alphaproteobacteria bacterium]|nr:hypothetical protein [Alphaproteobacteria bacterium]